MNEHAQPNRRNFLLTTSAGVAAGLSAAQYSALAQTGANETINMGIIGIGGRGNSLMDSFLRKDGVQFVAVCDVYVRRRKRAAEKAGLNPEDENAVFADYKDLLAR